MDNRQHRIFDGNPHLSPFLIILATFGIFLLVAVPPIGILLILIGSWAQYKRRSQFRQTKRNHHASEYAKYAKQQARAHADQVNAFRSL